MRSRRCLGVILPALTLAGCFYGKPAPDPKVRLKESEAIQIARKAFRDARQPVPADHQAVAELDIVKDGPTLNPSAPKHAEWRVAFRPKGKPAPRIGDGIGFPFVGISDQTGESSINWGNHMPPALPPPP